jgi:Predicted periplasmic or secreted lipoprotein
MRTTNVTNFFPKFLFAAIFVLGFSVEAKAYTFEIPDSLVPNIDLPDMSSISIPGEQLARDKLLMGEVVNELYQKHKKIYDGVVVNVFDGRAVVAGRIAKEADRDVIRQVLASVKGLSERHVDVEIGEPRDARTMAADRTIATTIETLFFGDSDIRVLNYSIIAYGGVAYILGESLTKREYDRAIDVASRVNGVRQVVDHIRIGQAGQ